MNTITGKIVTIGQTVNVSKKKEFLKRNLVLDCSRYDEFTGEKRENYVSMSFTQKRCDDLNAYQVGELVEVSFILNGRCTSRTSSGTRLSARGKVLRKPHHRNQVLRKLNLRAFHHPQLMNRLICHFNQ